MLCAGLGGGDLPIAGSSCAMSDTAADSTPCAEPDATALRRRSSSIVVGTRPSMRQMQRITSFTPAAGTGEEVGWGGGAATVERPTGAGNTITLHAVHALAPCRHLPNHLPIDAHRTRHLQRPSLDPKGQWPPLGTSTA